MVCIVRYYSCGYNYLKIHRTEQVGTFLCYWSIVDISKITYIMYVFIL